jgi:hypothetical protein
VRAARGSDPVSFPAHAIAIRSSGVFLSEILKRPKNETPYLLVPAGDPAGGAKVGDITKKHIDLPQRLVMTKDLPATSLPLATAA